MCIVRIGFKYSAVMLAASAVAVAIAAAPPAAADPAQQTCIGLSTSSTKCQSPGDVEINSSVPAPPAGPWAMYGPFWGGD